MKLSEKQQAFTLDIARLIMRAESLGIKLTFGEANRTLDQQWLYVNGKTIKDGELVDTGKKSWTYNSQHLVRLAVDFNFFIDGQLTYGHELIDQLGEYWESLDKNNKWGGHWKQNDTPHFERQL